MHGLRPLILCMVFTLVACSQDTVTETQPVKAEPARPTPDADKPEPALPAEVEPVQPDPVIAEKPAVNDLPTESVILKPGQSASIGDSATLHYVRLVSDSRCPPDVQCIWAGEASIELTLESGKEKQTFTLSDRENTKSMVDFSIELVSIDRDHVVNIRARKL